MASISATPLPRTAPLTTVDGTPLKTQLRRVERAKKRKALWLVLPLLAFIVVTFIFPIGDMLMRSVDNPVLSEQLPQTVAVLAEWDGQDLPSEAVFAAFAKELSANRPAAGKVGLRLNYEKSGMSSLLKKTARSARKLESGPYREALIKIDKRWGERDTWAIFQRTSAPLTAGYYLAAIDLRRDSNGEIQAQPDNRQIYVKLFMRTLWVSLLITGLCLLLGFPVAYLLAILPVKTSNLLLIMVLLPFWTSLLVRTTSWIVLLQEQGVVNDLLVWAGLIGEDGRVRMIYNMTGTVVAMVHILLPFMVLPLFSVMKTIPPSHMRAALSLGARPPLAFYKVYFPQTIPGIGAGSLLVFILAVGYYITPALVGGQDGQLISNFIAFHMQKSLNWGLAAALGGILLAGVLALYWLYNRLVGIDNMRLG